MFRSTTIIRDLAIEVPAGNIVGALYHKHSTQYTRHSMTCCHTTA